LIGVQEQRKGDQASDKFQSSSQGKIEEFLKGVKKVNEIYLFE
jgi:hypothetical protein